MEIVDRDRLANVLLATVASVAAGCGLLWIAAQAATSIGGADPPSSDFLSGSWALLDRPSDPAAAWQTEMSAPLYWVIVVVLATILMLVMLTIVWALFVSKRRKTEDPHRLAGLPTGRAAIRTAGTKALVARAAILRPSTHRRKVRATNVGYLLGRVGRKNVWLSVEDSLLALGPPRSGKGMNCVVPMILEAPGAVVATSLFTDNIALTMRQRARLGPISVFAPSVGRQLPSAMRWSPIRGCQEPDVAQLRATALAAGSARGVENASFWRDKTHQALYPMLHAAAISGATTSDFDRWCSGPAIAEEALSVLRDHPRAVPGWADKLDEIISADPRTRDNLWAGVVQATKSLSNPNVLAACSASADEQFDPDRFLAESGTLYVIGDDKGVDGPLVAALIEDIFSAAKRIANASPGNRLDPPLLLMLDEAANIAYLPSLPTMVSAGGGRGVTTVNIWQSRAQARDRWGPDAEGAIWGASTVKLIFGGLSDAQDLQDLSVLVGTREERTNTSSRNDDGTRSISTSTHEVSIMRPEQIATLPKGVALMVHPGQRPALVDLIPYTNRQYADVIAADQQTTAALLTHGV